MKQINWKKDWKWAVGNGFLFIVRDGGYQIVGTDGFGATWMLDDNETLTYINYSDGCALAKIRGWEVVAELGGPLASVYAVRFPSSSVGFFANEEKATHNARLQNGEMVPPPFPTLAEFEALAARVAVLEGRVK